MPDRQAEEMAIALEGASFSWENDEDGFRLDIPAWRLERGARAALIGASGSGKTTLLNLLAGVTQADRGVVQVFGADLTRLSSAARDRFRGDHIGLVFQMFNLLPFASVLENILLPLRFSSARAQRAGTAPEAEARRLISSLGLDPDKAFGKPVSALSVGQQQRVAAARALIGAPELIIADEPTSALDPKSRQDFLSLLFAEAERSGATLLTVTHDEAVADAFEQRIFLSDLTATTAREAA